MVILLCLMGLIGAPGQDVVKAVVTMENPTQHYYQIDMIFPASATSPRRVRMADWIPGSYRIRDFARHVSDFEALDLNDTPLEWRKTEKSTWTIAVPSGKGFKIRYRIFAYEFSVRTSYLDHFYGFINPASAFFYEPDGGEMRPHEIEIVPHNGWSAESGLSRRGSNLFLADNFDHLIDSPFQFGRFRRHDFEVRGLPHHWIIDGDLKIDESRMVESLKTIGEVVGDIFGGYPFQSYSYLSQFPLRDWGSNGLEHRNSTVIQFGSYQLNNKKGWDKFLSLMIHEYFHAWNVKAIQDTTLMSPNLQQETYTDLLWLHEGWTSYYDMQIMGRAGFYDNKEVLAAWAKEIETYNTTPGVTRQSLADASFNAWIHYYQAAESFRNDRISYYSAGALSGLAMDLLLRHKTKNEKGLDDLMRVFYQDYAKQGAGLDWDVVLSEIEKIGGASAVNLINQHILQPNPLPLETALGYAGLKLVYTDEDEKEPQDKDNPDQPEAPKTESGFKASPKVSLGITTKVDSNALWVKNVRRDSPAWRAGLDFKDEIIAINDRRVTTDNYDSLLSWSRPGDEITITVSRGRRIIQVPVRLEEKPKKLKLIRDENADDVQNQIYETVFRSAN